MASPFALHPPVILLIRAPQAVCLAAITTAAKPNLQRLNLRDLFTEGRRYYVSVRRDGFRVRGDSRLLWGRGRTPPAAVVDGAVSVVNEQVTLIRLSAHANWFTVVRALFIPVWMSWIALSMPWSWQISIPLVAAMFTLSLIASRANAQIQAADLVHFVEKAVEELPVGDVPGLGAGSPDVITHEREFRREWDRFYEEHKDER